MIKNLRFAIAALAMMTCGATYAQETTEPAEGYTKILFSDIYGGFEAENASKSVVYLEKHNDAIKNDIVSITFSKNGAVSAPNYNIANGYIALYGSGVVDGTKDEGNTMTYTSDRYFTQITLDANKAKPWASIKANVGTVTLGGKNGLCPIWTNKDAQGNTIDVKEVVFTVCNALEDPQAKDHVRYQNTQVYTSEKLPTGITSVTTNAAKNGIRYNVAGQRVGNDFKGLVIENGQKKIVK